MSMMTIFSKMLGFMLLLNAHPIKANSPNIVLVLTDDLDLQLDGMTPLLKTRSRLKNQGRTYKNAFATTPICCPSRSSILTGLRQDHTRVWNNSLSGNCGNQDWIKGHESSTFATYANKYNYKTAYFGKYLNQYGRTEKDPLRIPKGWDHWVGLVGNSKYYNYTLSVNGHPERHGDDYEKDYLTDVIKRKSLDFLKSHLESSSSAKNPFLMVLAPPSPHAPFTPAPQYSNRFSDLKAPRIPNFNYVRDIKHWLARKDPLSNQLIDIIDEVFRNRWRTLLSVDDLVDEVMEFLDQKNVLSNTYVIFTSDHGYHLGQYGLVVDKRMPYETDIRIPFFLYGPGIQPSTESKDVILNIDIAPTILDMMNVREKEYSWMDGSSILRQNSRNEFQIEYHGEHGSGIDKTCNIQDRNVNNCYSLFGCNCQDSKNNTYICKRKLDDENNFKHCWFRDAENFEEIYDLSKDPYELYNLYNYMAEPQVNIVK
ncbi:N-acetylglucosamine-6-sulfatase isoform X2 [Lepeophtheirus salmonis]|uniref:N-acetylglucosamine-6-sulfatase isoform X2 n=1 Tax=Lepeophtheirus salmonis TaxID=72036 RepID=UPI001AE359AE|nr:N-acetylglucosamine-6-sulfatase-like [Lepeophtheirus salmonis]